MSKTRPLLFALITAIAPAAVAANTTPLQLQQDDFPTLAAYPEIAGLAVFDTTSHEFPQNCRQLRIARLDDIAPRWRAHIEAPVLDDCRSAPPGATAESSSKAGIATQTWYSAHAGVKAGAASLHGLAVIEVREAQSERHGSRTLVLDAPLQRALTALRPNVERRCAANARTNSSIPGDCTFRRDDDGSWVITLGELNSTVRLSPDPDHPARTLHTLAGGD